MKTKILTLIMVICAGYMLQAQDWSRAIYVQGKKYPGYIVKSNGDKIEGYIKAQNKGSVAGTGHCNQTKVIFFSDPEDKKSKVVYKPADLKGYMIADKYYKTMNYSGGLLAKPIRFVLLVDEGQIARYVWYTDNEKRIKGVVQFDEQFVLQNGDNKPIEEGVLLLGFAKKVSELVSDNTELANKVKNKEKGFGAGSLDKIIAEYNEWYKENQK
jgi:hypothetical protein